MYLKKFWFNRRAKCEEKLPLVFLLFSEAKPDIYDDKKKDKKLVKGARHSPCFGGLNNQARYFDRLVAIRIEKAYLTLLIGKASLRLELKSGPNNIKISKIDRGFRQ